MRSEITVSCQEVHDSLPLAQRANDCTYSQRMADIAADEKSEAEARERAKRSPYDDFAQLNLDPKACQRRRKLILDAPSAYAVYDFLVEHASGVNRVTCSMDVIHEALGLSMPTVKRAIKLLKDREFVKIAKSGNTNVYMLDGELTWKSWGTNYRYAEFISNTIVSESEQREKPVKKMSVVTLKEDSQPTGKDSQQPEEDEWEDSLLDEGEPPEE